MNDAYTNMALYEKIVLNFLLWGLVRWCHHNDQSISSLKFFHVHTEYSSDRLEMFDMEVNYNLTMRVSNIF